MHAVVMILARYWRGTIALVLVAAVVGYVATLQRQIAALTRVIESQKTELAQARGAIEKLTKAVAEMKPGERIIVEVPKPTYIPYPVAGPPGPLRVEYIREPGRIETRVETIQLPPKEIEKILDRSPQSIIAEFTAIRDIAKGEKFRLVAAQISPGVYQPILELGAPVMVDMRTATPLERIPQAPTPSRWHLAAYTGYATFPASIVTGLRVQYDFAQRWSAEASAEYLWRVSKQDYRLVLIARF